MWRVAVEFVQNGALGRTMEMPIDLLAQSAALFCPYQWVSVKIVSTQNTTPSGCAAVCKTQCNRPSVSVLDISPPQEGNCLVQNPGNHPVRLRRRVQDAMQSPQCICTRHLPSTGGELPGSKPQQPTRQAAPPRARRDAIAPVYLY